MRFYGPKHVKPLCMPPCKTSLEQYVKHIEYICFPCAVVFAPVCGSDNDDCDIDD